MAFLSKNTSLICHKESRKPKGRRSCTKHIFRKACKSRRLNQKLGINRKLQKFPFKAHPPLRSKQARPTNDTMTFLVSCDSTGSKDWTKVCKRPAVRSHRFFSKTISSSQLSYRLRSRKTNTFQWIHPNRNRNRNRGKCSRWLRTNNHLYTAHQKRLWPGFRAILNLNWNQSQNTSSHATATWFKAGNIWH